jgi:hypothetical protein
MSTSIDRPAKAERLTNLISTRYIIYGFGTELATKRCAMQVKFKHPVGREIQPRERRILNA